MKNLIVTLLLCLSTLTACAKTTVSDGNEGPQAQPKLHQTPVIIAQMLTGSGFMAPPSAPRRITIDVLSDGQVNYVQTYQDGTVESKLLTTLSLDDVTKFQKLVATVQPGKLIDPNPAAPECMDAPGKVYYAILNDGTRIEVGANYDCKEYIKENESYADKQIKDLLKGFDGF